jgi:hypothetical protein
MTKKIAIDSIRSLVEMAGGELDSISLPVNTDSDDVERWDYVTTEDAALALDSLQCTIEYLEQAARIITRKMFDRVSDLEDQLSDTFRYEPSEPNTVDGPGPYDIQE